MSQNFFITQMIFPFIETLRVITQCQRVFALRGEEMASLCSNLDAVPTKHTHNRHSIP